jgi:hypothetical protein
MPKKFNYSGRIENVRNITTIAKIQFFCCYRNLFFITFYHTNQSKQDAIPYYYIIIKTQFLEYSNMTNYLPVHQISLLYLLLYLVFRRIVVNY